MGGHKAPRLLKRLYWPFTRVQTRSLGVHIQTAAVTYYVFTYFYVWASPRDNCPEVARVCVNILQL
jgi:hypothetical protein